MPGPAADNAPHILVVDDDERLRDLISRFLSKEGFRTTTAASAKEARARQTGLAFDAVILDVMMPEETGLKFLQTLRITNDIPVLMLTAMGDVEHRIAGLETGADDYLPKPFEPAELVLRLKSILKRTGPADTAESTAPPMLRFGPLTFDGQAEKLLRADGSAVRLTEAETRLIQILAARLGSPVSRDDLAHLTGAGQDRAIDVQVTRLRRKIERNPRDPHYLKTVRGVGYRLIADPDEAE